MSPFRIVVPPCVLLAGSVGCSPGSGGVGCFTGHRYYTVNDSQAGTDLGTFWEDVGVVGCHPSFLFPSSNQNVT